MPKSFCCSLLHGCHIPENLRNPDKSGNSTTVGEGLGRKQKGGRLRDEKSRGFVLSGKICIFPAKINGNFFLFSRDL